MKKFLWLAAFLGALPSQPAFATPEAAPARHFYRCTEPDGRSTFTDKPCLGEEGVRIKRIASDPSPTKVCVRRFLLPPECQRMQEELDLRIKMLSFEHVAPTSPAYLACLQRKVEACQWSWCSDAPRKDGGTGRQKKRYPTMERCPSPIDYSHLGKNPPRPLEKKEP